MQSESSTRLVKRLLYRKTLLLGGALLTLLHGQSQASQWAVTLTPDHVCQEVWNTTGGIHLQARFNHHDLPTADQRLWANLVNNAIKDGGVQVLTRRKPILQLSYDRKVLYATAPRLGGTKVGTVEFRAATRVPGFTGPGTLRDEYTEGPAVLAHADLFWGESRKVTIDPTFNSMPDPAAFVPGVIHEMSFVIQYEGCFLRDAVAHVAYRDDPVNASNVTWVPMTPKIRDIKSQLGAGGSYTVVVEGAALVEGASKVAAIYSRPVADVIPLALEIEASGASLPGRVTRTFVFAAPVEGSINRFGSDYRSFDATWIDSCQAACSSETQCKAWTWVFAGVQGPNAKCWLKNSVPEASRNTCCISGVKP